MADALVSEASVARHEGSSPSSRTKFRMSQSEILIMRLLFHIDIILKIYALP